MTKGKLYTDIEDYQRDAGDFDCLDYSRIIDEAKKEFKNISVSSQYWHRIDSIDYDETMDWFKKWFGDEDE